MLAKPRLTGWAARLAAEYAVREWGSLTSVTPSLRTTLIRGAHEVERNRAAGLGTEVHAAIDAWCHGEPHEHSREADPYMNSFTSFMMDKRPRVIASEVTVWNREHGYAGTADLICEIGGKVYLADWKCGKNLHDEVGLQLSALAKGEFIITPDGTELEMPRIDALAAIHIRPRSYKFTPAGYPEENFQAFLAAREIYRWSTETAPRVLGQAA